MAKKKNWVDYKRLKAAASLEMVLERYGVLGRLKKSGQNLAGCCPIHNGTNPRQFSVSLEKNAWQCFGDCQTGGNQIDFVALKEFGSKEPENFRKAALLLKNWFQAGDEAAENGPDGARNGPEKTAVKAGNERVREEKSARQEETAGPEKSARQDAKLNNKPAGKERGTAEEEPSKVNPPLKFSLKNLDPAHPFFAEHGLAPDTVRLFGLGYCLKGMMTARIAIPIHDHGGELVAYCGRAVSAEQVEKEGKYKLPPNFHKSGVVYNLNRLASQVDELILVESYLSVWKLTQGGKANVAALMGSSLSEAQEKLIWGRLKPSGRILLAFDADESGQACTNDCLLRLGRHAFVWAVDISPYATKPHQLPERQIKLLF